MVRGDELPVAALQVRSLAQLGSKPKKARATLGGMTARRLAAHRRLIAAISVEGKLFSELGVGLELIVSRTDESGGR
jgi:hypothetical protein